MQKNGAKNSLLKVVIRRQRYLNVAPLYNDKREAIGQAPTRPVGPDQDYYPIRLGATDDIFRLPFALTSAPVRGLASD
jgi:hypothetical protein